MKYIYLLFASITLLLLSSCEKDYELSTDFTIPTELVSPASILLDVKSLIPAKLSWKGGEASDGSYVIYEVLIDKAGGDFSKPLYRSFSDFGTDHQLSIPHTELNKIARQAGVKPDTSGDFIWTLYASKGGEVRHSGLTKTITLSRPAGLEIPDKLYLHGAGNENGGTAGLLFRQASDGVFVIYTKVNAGALNLKGEVGTDVIDYHINGATLEEGTESITVAPNVGASATRITIDFNALTMKAEVISNVRAIWGVTYGVIGNLQYDSNGKFVDNNSSVIFVSASRPETNPPGWLGWVEDRYYFIATIDGVDTCWGRNEDISENAPPANALASFYELGQFTWSQWLHLWKMSPSLDMKKCTITIDTNKDGMMIHQFSNVAPL